MFWNASHLCNIKTDWVLFTLINLLLKNWKLRRKPSKFWHSEPMNVHNTYIPPILGGFPCSQAHLLLTYDQPDPKNNYSPIKKNTTFWPHLTRRPLKKVEPWPHTGGCVKCGEPVVHDVAKADICHKFTRPNIFHKEGKPHSMKTFMQQYQHIKRNIWAFSD